MDPLHSPTAYWAFISYSHRDARTAVALRRAIETYAVPKRLVGTRTVAGVVPARLKPVFIDRDELQAGPDLKQSVHEALAHSRYLIVLCSPEAARSPWVNGEVAEFKRRHGSARILAVILRGEPFAGRTAGRESDECFPPALVAAGPGSGATVFEPITVDLRPHADGKRRAILKLIAGMLGVGADELLQRDARRRLRQLAVVAVAAGLGFAVMSVLTVDAIRSRNEARSQRGQAEELLEFMLGDLRKKLTTVGRLDVLDGVGDKALAYYAQQNPERLDANSLGRRSRALHLIGEQHEVRGQLEAAQVAFDHAARTTAQLLERAPQIGQRVFDHAQSVYWVGYLSWRRGQAEAAEKAFREYVRLAERLRQIDPRNLDWLAETSYAQVNVGVVSLHTGRLKEAVAAFEAARVNWLRMIEANPARVLDLANALGWISKAREAQEDFHGAINAQREKIQLLEQMPNAESNQQVKRHLRTTYYDLAYLELGIGRIGEAIGFAERSRQMGEALVAVDPENKTWLEQLYHIAVMCAELALVKGDQAGAREHWRRAANGARELLADNPQIADWQVNLRGRVLWLATRLADKNESSTLVAELADYLETTKKYSTDDRLLGRGRDRIVARAELALGELLAERGEHQEAAGRWRAAVTRMRPHADAGDLHAMTEVAWGVLRLGDLETARALARRLEASTYRHPSCTELLHAALGR